MITLAARQPIGPLPAEAWALADAYLAVFGTDQGKRVQADLEAQSGLLQSAIPDTGPVDPLRLAAREGRRELYMYIREQLVIATAPERTLPEVTGAQDAYGDPMTKETA